MRFATIVAASLVFTLKLSLSTVLLAEQYYDTIYAADGIRIARWSNNGSQPGYTVMVASDGYDIRVVVPFFGGDPSGKVYRSNSSRGVTGQTLEIIMNDTGSNVAFSGGYLKSYAPPLPIGLVMVDGYVVNRLEEKDKLLDAVICFSSGGAEIVDMMLLKGFEIASRIAQTGATSCLQAGPLLVDGGFAIRERHNSSKETFWNLKTQRSFVGKNQIGDVVLGIIENVDMDELIDWIITNPASGGLGLDQAMYLPGGGGGGFVWIDETGHTQSVGNVFALQANAIVVVPQP